MSGVRTALNIIIVLCVATIGAHFFYAVLIPVLHESQEREIQTLRSNVTTLEEEIALVNQSLVEDLNDLGASVAAEFAFLEDALNLTGASGSLLNMRIAAVEANDGVQDAQLNELGANETLLRSDLESVNVTTRNRFDVDEAWIALLETNTTGLQAKTMDLMNMDSSLQGEISALQSSLGLVEGNITYIDMVIDALNMTLVMTGPELEARIDAADAEISLLEGNVTSLGNALDALNISLGMTGPVLSARLDAVEADDIIQDGRLTSLEGNVTTLSMSPPTGSAGGDLSGTYPNPTVAKWQGTPVSSSAPSNGAMMAYTGTQWAPESASPYAGLNTATNHGTTCVTFGDSASTLAATQAVAVGNAAVSTGFGAVALGAGCSTTGDFALCLGLSAVSNATQTIAIGNGAQATANGAVALGTGITANQVNGFFALHRDSVTPAAARVAAWDSSTSEVVGLPFAGGTGYTLTSDAAGNLAWLAPTAGGDLTGTYPNPTLAAIGTATGPIGDATHVATTTIDAKGRVTALTSTLITGTTPGGSAGGDLTGTYPNPTLASIGSATGPIGDATHVATTTIDAKGRVTALTSTLITGTTPGGSAGGDLTGTYPNPTLAAIGSATGPIGDATHVATTTIDAKGRVTALTSTLITGTTPGGAAGGDLTGTYPNPTLVTGFTAGTFGGAGQSASITTDTKGRVTAISNVAAPQIREVSLTLAQFTGMFTTPVQIIAAPGSGSFVVVHDWSLQMTYGSASTANGGTVNLQYGATAGLGGQPCATGLPGTTVNAWTSSSLGIMAGPVVAGGAASLLRTTVDNQQVTISNSGAAFTGGTGATFKVSVTYSVYT